MFAFRCSSIGVAEKRRLPEKFVCTSIRARLTVKIVPADHSLSRQTSIDLPNSQRADREPSSVRFGRRGSVGNLLKVTLNEHTS
jgi:hypothetical protein